MNEGKILVVYFSRTGITRSVADAIHRELGGDLTEVITHYYPRNLRGYLQAGLDSALGRAVPILTQALNVADYDLVIVGTPVWNSSLSAPIRTYMAQSLAHAKQVAFFVTNGGSGTLRALGQMEQISGRAPLATLAITATEVDAQKYTEKLASFVKVIRKAIGVLQAA